MSTAGACLPHENGILHLTRRLSTPSWTRGLCFSLSLSLFISLGDDSRCPLNFNPRPSAVPTPGGLSKGVSARHHGLRFAWIYTRLSSLATSGCVGIRAAAIPQRAGERWTLLATPRALDSRSSLSFPAFSFSFSPNSREFTPNSPRATTSRLVTRAVKMVISLLSLAKNLYLDVLRIGYTYKLCKKFSMINRRPFLSEKARVHIHNMYLASYFFFFLSVSPRW